MTSNPEKAALRKHLLEKRDSTSFDLMEIHSKKIISKLMKTKMISEAKSIGCYYSIGSEVQTIELITHLLEEKKTVSLPAISNDTMSFRKIEDLTKLEKGEFDIPEPKDNAPIQETEVRHVGKVDRCSVRVCGRPLALIFSTAAHSVPYV